MSAPAGLPIKSSMPKAELRDLQHSDAERMLRWMRDPEVADNLGLRSEPTLERTEAWIAAAHGNRDRRGWAIVCGEEHVGNVVLDQVDAYLRSARLSIYLGEPSARGQGVATAALRLALTRGFGEQKLERVWLTVHERNTRAALLYTRFGFRFEGILRGEFLLKGERINAILMSMLRSEFTALAA